MLKPLIRWKAGKMEPYTYLENLALNEIPADGIISRTLVKNDHVKMLLFGFGTGEELSEHTSTHPAILYFLQGEADLVLGEDKQVAKAGTWVYMEPNLAHSIYAKTPVVMQLIMLQD